MNFNIFIINIYLQVKTWLMVTRLKPKPFGLGSNPPPSFNQRKFPKPQKNTII